MKDYRVREELYEDGSVRFYPMFREDTNVKLPKWEFFTVCSSKVYYETLEDAQTHIENDIELTIQNNNSNLKYVTYHNYNI